MLALALMVALLISIGAVSLLLLTTGERYRGRFHRWQAMTRYAEEGAIVFVQQHLWNETAATPYPPGCSAGGNGTVVVPVGGISVNVTVTNCGAGNVHTITARVTY